MKRLYWKYGVFLLAVLFLTACGKKEPESTANMQTPAAVAPDDSSSETKENGNTAGEGAETGKPEQSDEESVEPTAEAGGEIPGQSTETPEGGESEPPVEGAGQGGNRVINDLSSGEWEQIEQNEAVLKFRDGDGGYLYVDPEAGLVYHQEIYAHEREEGSEVPYFHPQYSSKSDDTMFAESADEGGGQRYDVYVGKELMIRNLSIDAEEMHNAENEYGDDVTLDVCYDADAQEVLLMTWHEDSEKKEKGFMIYHASVRDDCMQPFRFYPVLTGEAYQELVVPDWIWSALLTPEAIYYDILPVLRIDRETGNVTEWGLTEEAYTQMDETNHPIRHLGRTVAGDGYIMTIVPNPDPAFEDMPENTVDTYLVYTEVGELVCMIPNMH